MSATKQAISSPSRLFSSTQNLTQLAEADTSVAFASTTTAAAAANQRIMTKKNYTERQLKDALESLLEGSSDTAHDGTHIYGFGDESHSLSMLQTITATRILDYTAYMVRSLPAIQSLSQSFSYSLSYTVPMTKDSSHHYILSLLQIHPP